MGLSDELISQFVKITNDTKKTKGETTVYGEIVEYNGSKYVRLDGSELLTPIATTTNVAPGERVTVMIKNHTATVTGNVSSPSARVVDIEDQADAITELEIAIAKKVDTEQLIAEQARIDSLVAENVTIKQKLAASDAVIEDLEAGNITVTEQLVANAADIEELKTKKLDADVAVLKYAEITDLQATDATLHNLESTYAEFTKASAERFEAIEADIEDLNALNIKATYATIAQLNVERGRITALESEVSDIDTLIFGSATGNVIQTSFANAVIAQLGEAQIKSAMIESVSASKLSAGEVNTNKVSLVSEDGKLVISDETLQISDGTRVRVQIGKDASNDYSINIWDADGNLMFSEGGITDSAIKEAIIRNDMVSDTANIAAHKLNIDSLFEEINGSEKTIKSARVYLDEEGQSLDVAFKSMTTDVDGLSETVSSQGSKISVLQDKFSSKVWQNDIDTAVNEVGIQTETLSTQYEELQQDVNGMVATVASHTSQIGLKADTSTVVQVTERVSSLETNLSGFKSTVSETYVSKSDMDRMTTRMSAAETSISQNSTAIELRTSELEADIAVAQAAADGAQGTATSAEERATSAESLIQLLTESLSTLVTDTNGQSLMTQTENGWTFSTEELQRIVDTTSENLDALTNEVGDVSSIVSILRQSVDDLGILSEYINIGTYEGEPCIELGESDSDFKLLITNTRIMFREGSGVPAYFNNQSMYIKKAVVEEELRQGEFIWKARSNGNLGLIWKGATS